MAPTDQDVHASTNLCKAAGWVAGVGGKGQARVGWGGLVAAARPGKARGHSAHVVDIMTGLPKALMVKSCCALGRRAFLLLPAQWRPSAFRGELPILTILHAPL
jgi:hypothetical protein